MSGNDKTRQESKPKALSNQRSPAEMVALRAKASEARRKGNAIPRERKIELMGADHGALPLKYAHGGTNGQGSGVFYGWTTAKNRAGFYVSFREVRRKNGDVVRSDFSARRVRRKAGELACRRADAFSQQHDPGNGIRAAA